MWRDVMDLTGCCNIDQVIGLDLNLVARGKEGVKAHDKVRVAFEELRYSANNPRSVDAKTKKHDKKNAQMAPEVTPKSP